MKSFNSFLLEARRNPKVNIKANPVKALEKYDADNFYATYIKSPDQFDSLSKKDTENMRKDSPQVMLNINNRFNTLHGIYCYEISMMYVAGTKIDWREEVFGSQFEIINPNAQSGCGCGESFSM